MAANMATNIAGAKTIDLKIQKKDRSQTKVPTLQLEDLRLGLGFRLRLVPEPTNYVKLTHFMLLYKQTNEKLTDGVE